MSSRRQISDSAVLGIEPQSNSPPAAARSIDLSTPEDAPPPPKIFATELDDPSGPVAPIDPAIVSGVRPGESLVQLTDQWGEGETVSTGPSQRVLAYSVESFKHVEVTVVDDAVRTISIHLDTPMLPETLIRQLKLVDARPVNVPDDSGELLGQAFPERGVLFSLTPDGQRGARGDRKSRRYAVRAPRKMIGKAARTRPGRSELCALPTTAKRPSTLRLRAKVYATVARYEEMLADVEAALAAEPDQPLYHLTHAEILGRQGNFEDAGKETKDVLSTASLPEELKAKSAMPAGRFAGCEPSARLQASHGSSWAARGENCRPAFDLQTGLRSPCGQTHTDRSPSGCGQRYCLRLLAAKRDLGRQVAGPRSGICRGIYRQR